MIKRPLIVGCLGVMGQRYSAVLRYLGVDFLSVDAGDSLPGKGNFDGAIIATPTHIHPQSIRRLWDYRVPLLVEKPLADDATEVMTLCRDAERDGVRLRMVNQYEQLVPKDAEGDTRYDYYRHGKDGLGPDCISILALAKGRVFLGGTSPIWRCQINGHTLSLADMDGAYVEMIKGWLMGETDGIDYIRKAHLKLREWQATHG